MSSSSILQVRNLTKRYDDEAGSGEILRDVNLSIEKKEFLCILGPSGCGKTTFLRCIAGFEQYEGEILVNGERKSGPGTDRIMVFQDFNQLFPWKTVEKNICYPLRLQGIKDKETLQQLSGEAIRQVKLTGYEKYYPHQLSGGMKQRVAIAKALVLKPEIILMDEPFAALDAMTRNQLQDEVLRISQDASSTVIFITHNIQEALILSTRILVFSKDGDIILNEPNPLEKPVSPASEGYGQVWEKLHRALYSGGTNENNA